MAKAAMTSEQNVNTPASVYLRRSVTVYRATAYVYPLI